MICPIHFESNLFKGAKKGKFDFDRAIALYNSSGPSLLKDGLISVRQMDEKSRLIYPSNFVVKIVKFAKNVLKLELKKDRS